MINQSIALEQPQYANYLIQPKRAAKFGCVDNPQEDTKKVEKDFTKAVRYKGWQSAYLKTVDGAQLHGSDAVEVEYDPSKPGAVNVVHIGYENLIYPTDSRNLQACEGILIRKYMNAKTLKTFVDKYGFNSKVVNELCQGDPVQARVRGDNYAVYKFYFKHNGQLYLGWVAETGDGWLKEPKPYKRGRTEAVTQMGLEGPTVEHKDVVETQFPVHQYIYKLNEEEELTKQTGRAAEDDAVQEAQTNLWSAGVNGAVKSADTYAATEQPISGGGKPSVVDIELIPGRVYDQPLKFFKHPGADSTLIPLANSLLSNQQAMQGQVNFAATNRKDSRKTAKEVESAERTQQNLNAVSNVQFSTFLSSVYNDIWSIVKSAALRGQIKFCVDVQTGQNDIQKISYEYTIIPAGEIDVIERDEKIQKIFSVWDMAASWPMVQKAMFAEVIQTLFLEDAEIFLAALEQSDRDQQMKAGVRELLNVITTAPPEELPEAIQEMQPNIDLLMNQLGGQEQ